MDYSTNGTGVHPPPSTTMAQLQSRQQAPMFTSFDYPSTTIAATAPDPVALEHLPCFLEGIGFSSRTARGNNSEGKGMHRSYQPNGIKDGSGVKTTGRNLMNTPSPSVGGVFGEILNGHQTANEALSGSEKRSRCANGSEDNPNAQVTFQELSAVPAEPMNYTMRSQSSQETATSSRKRRSMSQNVYSAEYFSSESNQPGRDSEIMDAEQAPSTSFCFSQENPPPQGTAQMCRQPAAPPQSAPPKAEPSSHKRFHMGPPMMRRSPRLTQEPMQQQQQQYVAPQKFLMRHHQLRAAMLDPDNGRTLIGATNRPRRMTAFGLYNSNYQQHNQVARHQYTLRSYANMQGFDSSASTAPSLSNVSECLLALPPSTTAVITVYLRDAVLNYFYDPTANRSQLATTSTPNVAWDPMTRRQLAAVDDSRWRLPGSISTSPSQSTSQTSQDQQTQPQPTPPHRKNYLLFLFQPGFSGLRMFNMTPIAPEFFSMTLLFLAKNVLWLFHSLQSHKINQEAHISRLPSLLEAHYARLSVPTVNLSQRITAAPALPSSVVEQYSFLLYRLTRQNRTIIPNFLTGNAREAHHTAFDIALFHLQGFDVEAKERSIRERTDGGDSDSAESMVSTSLGPEYVQPNQFEHFDKHFPSTWNGVKLALIQQPELQHRARYLTEGSRGPIKNRNFDGYPTIQLTGWTGPATVHVFVPTNLQTHICISSTKSVSSPRKAIADAPNLFLDSPPVDSVGLVKLRNSDVERRMSSVMEEGKRKKGQKQEKFGRLSNFSHPSPPGTSSTAVATSSTPTSTSGECSKSVSLSMGDDLARRSIKPKSSSTRLVYRVLLLSPENTVEGVVQVISDPIRCTQIVGGPEITRMSIRESDTRSQPELFIIGKNFVRGTRVIFRQLAAGSGLSTDLTDDDKPDVQWERDAEIEPPFFSQTHLICKVPEYNGPSLPLTSPLRVHVYIQTPNKVGRPETFTYLPTLPVRGPPTITRLSHREAPARGLVDLIVLGTNFSPNCRVLFRQVVLGTDVGGVFGGPTTNVYDENQSLVWQREARINTDDLTNNYLVCRVPPYDGQPSHLLTPLQVQIIVEGPGGSSAPEKFYYVQCK
ncbi:hypothetical protein Aperf_G00000085926 [Anoplocephala perfoliata]